MDVEIDRGRCQGHARCTTLAPEVFELDDDGFVELVHGADLRTHEAAARRAAGNCPEYAITVRETGEGTSRR